MRIMGPRGDEDTLQAADYVGARPDHRASRRVEGPRVVVEDTGDRMLLWLPQGTRRKVPATPAHRPDPQTRTARIIENLAHGDWAYGDHVWEVWSLWILYPEDWHAVWVSWTSPGRRLGWYVNLQRPYRRTPLGIEAMDLMLDIVVEPDMAWRWKDDDERGVLVDLDAGTAERTRQEAAKVISRIENREPPFSEPWPDWRPSASWRLPVLSDGWNEPF